MNHMQFSGKDKQILLEYSRRVLAAIVNDDKTLNEPCPNDLFNEKAGVFVSLHKGKELRGCIGYIEPIVSIWSAVAENTISAATNDFRFDSVTPDELDDIKIEISVLTPPVACGLEEIKEGIDGVIIQQGEDKATYLPQVWEGLPNKEEFFNSLCLKANLDEHCWRNKQTRFFKYQAIVFSE